MAQTITTDGDGERLGEGVERVWGPLPLERTAEFGAHAPVRSFVVRPRLGVCLLEAVERDVIGDEHLPTTRRPRRSGNDWRNAPLSTTPESSTRRELALETSSTRTTLR